MGNRSLAVSGSNDNDLVSLICYTTLPSSLFIFPPPQWCSFLFPICFFFFFSLLFLSCCYFWCLIAIRLAVVAVAVVCCSKSSNTLSALCVCVLCAGATRADRLQMTTKGVVRIPDRYMSPHSTSPPRPTLFATSFSRKREREKRSLPAAGNKLLA
jgi:hypothetical protein